MKLGTRVAKLLLSPLALFFSVFLKCLMVHLSCQRKHAHKEIGHERYVPHAQAYEIFSNMFAWGRKGTSVVSNIVPNQGWNKYDCIWNILQYAISILYWIGLEDCIVDYSNPSFIALFIFAHPLLLLVGNRPRTGSFVKYQIKG